MRQQVISTPIIFGDRLYCMPAEPLIFSKEFTIKTMIIRAGNKHMIIVMSVVALL